jgi:hypothetical protein
MNFLFQMGDFDVVSGKVFVALERRQCGNLRGGVAQLDGIRRHRLDQRHRDLPLTAAVHGDHDVADLM